MTPDPAAYWPRYPTLLRPLAAGAVVWAVVSLPFVTDAGAGLGVCLVVPAAGLIGLVWVGVTVGLFSAGFRPRLNLATAAWAVTPTLLAGVLLIGWSGIGLAARVKLSEQALLAAGAGDDSRPGWVGLFHIVGTERTEAGAVAFDTGTGFFDRDGLLYLPAGADPPPGWKAVGHLTGNWHRGYWRF